MIAARRFSLLRERRPVEDYAEGRHCLVLFGTTSRKRFSEADFVGQAVCLAVRLPHNSSRRTKK